MLLPFAGKFLHPSTGSADIFLAEAPVQQRSKYKTVKQDIEEWIELTESMDRFAPA